MKLGDCLGNAESDRCALRFLFAVTLAKTRCLSELAVPQAAYFA